jgi:DNA-binding beta-propeller fold protein YncE
MSLVSERPGPGLFPAVSAVIVLALIGVLALGATAGASELVYWNNYGADPDNVAFAGMDGGGGGVLNTGSQVVEGPEGMAYDTAGNRLFVTNETGTNGQVLAINLDGSGAAPFTAPGATIEEPEGVAVDPTRGLIFWENVDTETISWAKLDGSAGGTLNTTGATLDSPCCRIAVDPSGGRVYWVNTGPSPDTIGYANLDNSGGGGQLNLTGSTVEPGGEGLAVDSAAGRLYFLGGEKIGFANVNGTGGGDVPTGSGIFNGTWGLGFDPSKSTLYWGNESNGADERTNAIGFVNLSGIGGGISPVTAPVDNPQDPVIIKSPSGTGAPTLARDSKNRAALSCTQGTWAGDFAGGFVYQAPRSFAYQWARNGAPVGGATAATFGATSAGQYTCAVTATNQAGTGVQTSAAINVKAAKIKLTTKKKAKAEAGDLVKFKVKAVNQGDLKPKNAKLCVTLPKSAKDDLKAPKCKKANLSGGVKKTFTIKLKVKGGADLGTNKLTFKVKGSAGKAAKSKVVVK